MDAPILLALQAAASIEVQRDPNSHLWVTAFHLSVLLNLIFAGVLGYSILNFNLKTEAEVIAEPVPESSTLATVYFEPLLKKEEPELIKMPPKEKPFARTSADQPTSTEKTHERIGEHSTRATSDRAPDPNAKPLPSQTGVQPKEGEIETTESQYQDGELSSTPPAAAAALVGPSSPSAQPSPLESSQPTPPQDLLAQEPTPSNPAETEINPDSTPTETRPSDPTLSEERSLPPPRETLLQGPDPLEVKVPNEVGDAERPREKPQQPTDKVRPDSDQPPAQRVAQNPPAPQRAPVPNAFQGNQRKTAMIGSISRSGRSALNVDDTEMGRYQAAIGKAVELEWQRNCVRHRDYITPGFLTVRFFVEPDGRVRSIKLLGEVESSEIQKGFTFSAIREADIPKMPKELADAYEGDSMELVFRFFF